MDNRKIHTTVTIDKELMDWIQNQIRRKRFRSISHAVEYCLLKDKERVEKE